MKYLTLLSCSSVLLFNAFFFYSSQVLAGLNEASFTPDSILVPIREIGFTNTTTGASQSIYTCSGSSQDECLVDITDEAALGALFSSAPPIDEGTYQTLYVSNCLSEGSYSAKIKGVANISGVNYYTADTSISSDVLTTNSALQGYAEVVYSGCKTNYQLPSTLTVAAGDSVALSLFTSNIDIAWMRLGSKTIPSGCIENIAQTQSVCMAYPDIIPYIGANNASLERYYIIEDINNPQKLGGQILLVVDSLGDNVLAGFTRRYFSNTSAPMSANFDTPLKQVIKNADNTYDIENYGSSRSTYSARFANFQRQSHSGNYLLPDGATKPYYAYRNVASELGECAPDLPFSSPLVDMDASGNMLDFQYVVPLGNLNPGGGHVFPTDHIYYYLKINNSGSPVATSIYAPGDIWITKIARSEMNPGTASSKTDYAISFSPCKDLYGKFMHMATLSDELQTIFDSVPEINLNCSIHSAGGNAFRDCSLSTRHLVSAGSEVAKVFKTSVTHAVDFLLTDSRVAPLSFANPSHFSVHPTNDDLFHTVCPLDYFTEPLKSQMESVLGGSINGGPVILRTTAPLCGSIVVDIVGTAQGIWFNPAQPTYPEDSHLSLVHDNMDTTLAVFAIGNSVTGLSSNTYMFTPTSSPATRINVDFSLVAPGNIYCYDNFMTGSAASPTLLLNMPDTTTIQIEKTTATDCASLGAPSSWLMSSYSEFKR